MATPWLTFALFGNRTTKQPWQVATTVAWDFEAVDTANYPASMNLVFEMETGTVNMDVKISWSASGLIADAHDLTNPIDTTGATHSIALTQADRKDRFMHVNVIQAGTIEDVYSFIDGVS